MQILKLVAAAVLAVAGAAQADAFAHGYLIPSYLCYPPTVNDGLPKSLGGVLATIPNAAKALEIAKWHNSEDIMAKQNLVNVTLADPSQPLIPGRDVALKVQSNPAGTPLVGLILYALDENNVKIGHFTEFGLRMAPFKACSHTSRHPHATIVHMQELAVHEEDNYVGIVWHVPKYLRKGDVVRFTGLAVTDNGFGFHMSPFTVTEHKRRVRYGDDYEGSDDYPSY